MASCAYCALRAAEVVDMCDGRLVPACRKCVNEETPDPGRSTESARDRLRWALRFNPGSRAFELFNTLDVPTKHENLREHNRYWAALRAMLIAGEVYRTGPRNEGRYWLTETRAKEVVSHAHA